MPGGRAGLFSGSKRFPLTTARFAPTVETTGELRSEEDDQLLRRAVAAFLRDGGEPAPIPKRSSVRELTGKRYVIVRDSVNVYAVYRVRANGFLKRLKRYPKTLVQDE